MSAPWFTRREDGELMAEASSLTAIAEQFGTPCYVYSRAALETAWQAYAAAFAAVPHQICYAVKANSNLAVLDLLARLGSGFDIVSVGELERVLAAGGDAGKVVFSGVGKQEAEIVRALEVGVGCFNVESPAELERLAAVAARLGRRAPLALRVNPDVDAGTHPYIATGLSENKFGIALDEAGALYRRWADNPALDFIGIASHIGSQITSTAPYVDAVQRVLALVDELAADGIVLDHLDIGGGLGIHYRDETVPTPSDLAAAVLPLLFGRDLSLQLEPGRSIVGPAGLLLTRVEYCKHNGDKRFVVVDAAMNDLLRPSLYGAWQAIEAVAPVAGRQAETVDVVGPVCETGDFLGKDRQLAVVADELLVVRDAGAYGFVMSSNYNSRPRAAEVLVDGGAVHLVRRRELPGELFSAERIVQ